jgi:hypothetical protein
MDPRWYWLGGLLAIIAGLFGALLYFGDTEPKGGDTWGAGPGDWDNTYDPGDHGHGHGHDGGGHGH